MDNKVWNRAKAEYCKKNGIQLHIDDSDVYGKYFETPYARFESLKPEENLVQNELPVKPGDMSESPGSGIVPGLHAAMTTPALTVDIAIMTIIEGRLHVLLTKRDLPPFKDHWAIPGGFIDIENKESLEAAAARKLQEKTGLKDLYVEQLKTYGDVDRDTRSRVVTTAYFALVNHSLIKDQTPSNTQWFPLKNLEERLSSNQLRLAFDHELILKDLRKRLQKKITYTPIAFEFLDKTFTWTELRTVYETVLDKPLDPANFKKKIRTQYSIKELKARKTTTSAGRPPVYVSFEGVKDQYI
jgi:8-oxo-dGTP diphosphatase